MHTPPRRSPLSRAARSAAHLTAVVAVTLTLGGCTGGDPSAPAPRDPAEATTAAEPVTGAPSGAAALPGDPGLWTADTSDAFAVPRGMKVLASQSNDGVHAAAFNAGGDAQVRDLASWVADANKNVTWKQTSAPGGAIHLAGRDALDPGAVIVVVDLVPTDAGALMRVIRRTA